MRDGPSVAILVWGDAVEDFLDPLGVSVRQFAEEMDGGWFFGYAEALRQAGVRPVLICVSRDIIRPKAHVNKPTGAVFWVLPLPRRYSPLRRLMDDPYATHVGSAFPPGSRLPTLVRHAVRDLVPYLPLPALALARVLRSERIDALLVQEYESARFDLAVAVGGILEIPVFASFQGGTRHVSRAERLVRPRALRASAGLVIGSEAEAVRVRHRYDVPARKIARIFNPLDAEEWTGPSRDDARQALGVSATAEVVAWHGRVDIHRKGLDVLLDAWTHVVAARPGRYLSLRLMGTGADAAELHARLADGPPGVTWRDEYVLDRAEIRQHLAVADIYVLSSRQEGFPVALIEALASGLPAVAADAPGVRDVLGIDRAGLIVPTGDAEALATALGRLLDDGDLRDELGHAARARAASAFGHDTVGMALRRFLLPDHGPA